MKKRRRRKINREKFEVLRLWTYEEVAKALPYVRGIAASLRENWLQAQNLGLQISRLSKRPGRPDKAALLALEDARLERDRAEDACQDDLQDLLDMHVFPCDVQQGLAFIPFRNKEELAWFVFDLFESNGLTSWRYHRDPLTERRPIGEFLEVPAVAAS